MWRLRIGLLGLVGLVGCAPTGDGAVVVDAAVGDAAATADADRPPEIPLAVVSSRTGVETGAHGGAVVPGALVAGHFALPTGGAHTNLSGSMRVEIDPGDTTSYFFAQQFFFAGGDGGYMGLQTNGYSGGVTVGKMIIVSVWQATGAEPGGGVTCEPFGGEGEGESCRLAYPWDANTAYLFRVEEDAPGSWRVTIEPDDRDPMLIGTFRVPSTWGRLEPTSAIFTEYYGPVASCETIPLAQARFGDVSADDGAAVPVRVDAEVTGPCAAAAVASCTGDSCVRD